MAAAASPISQAVLNGEAAVYGFAALLAPVLRPEDLILIDGELGSGKTTLVRGLVQALGGAPEQVTSPTYTLMHHYAATIPVLHVDAYRLSGMEDLENLGFFEFLPSSVGCVEWAGRCGDWSGLGPCFRITLDHRDQASRALRWSLPDGRSVP